MELSQACVMNSSDMILLLYIHTLICKMTLLFLLLRGRVYFSKPCVGVGHITALENGTLAVVTGRGLELACTLGLSLLLFFLLPGLTLWMMRDMA